MPVQAEKVSWGKQVAYQGRSALRERTSAGMVVAWQGTPEFNGLIAAHELGHYLGLFHTTEKRDTEALDPSAFDPIEDTLECAPTGATTDGRFCLGQGPQYIMFLVSPAA